MIIDFTVTNFRSIQKEQTLSMVAETRGNSLAQNYSRIDEDLAIFKTAGVYGANASGKSNLLLAIEALIFIVTRSERLSDGDPIPPYEPYLFAEKSSELPTTFELEFITKNETRYLYFVSFSSHEIVEESLDYYSSKSKSNLFSRKKGDNWKDISFGNYYKGGKRKFPVFMNNSYLGKAGNSADAPKIIRSAFNYIRNGIFHLGSHQQVRALSWTEDTQLVGSMKNILGFIDTGIVGFEVKKVEENPNLRFPEEVPESVRKQIIDENRTQVLFIHKGKDGETGRLTEQFESSGTLKMFRSLPLLIGALRDGETLFLDELDNSLHPHMAELIIRLFNDPAVNKNNAQLIFSTHNINLMSPELLRRDQIWLIEKIDGASNLYSLDEFDKSEVKLNSPYNKWYDQGRFGAVPLIDYESIAAEFSKMCSTTDAEA